MTLKDKKTIKMNVVDTISVLCTQSSFLAREYSHRDSRIWETAVTVRWEGGSQGYLRSLLQDILSICQHTTDQMWRAHEASSIFPRNEGIQMTIPIEILKGIRELKIIRGHANVTHHKLYLSPCKRRSIKR